MTTAISANQDGNTKSSDDFVLSVSDLRLGTLEGAEILHGVDYTLKRGEIVCLVGESGSGKTTAGLAAMGHLRPGLMLFDGTVTLHSANGTDYDVLNLSEADLRELRGSRIAYVPQDPALSLNPTMRIGEQIREVLDVHSFDGDAGARVREVMRDVDLPDTDEYLARWPHQLSGGQQQRVGIAMAFAMYPDVLILDEPTTGLDVSTQAHVLDTVREMTHKNDIASLYITHDLAVVAELADRVVVMLRGDIVEEGPAQAVLYNPQHPYTQKLLAAIPDLPGRKNITGHGIASAVQVEERDSAAPLLQVNNLEMAYGDNKVLHGIDLTLEEGESILLLGESGSGKTTLARSIAGLNPGYTGEVRLRGELLEHGSRERTVDQRQYVQYIFQSPFSSLNPRRTIGESLSVPLVMSGKLSRKEHRRVVEDVLEAVQLDRSFYDRRPGDLSGGERQRAAIGRALVNAPDVLVCDEITSALDVSVQASILELLADLRAECGLSMLFVTHNIALARHTATRIAVLNKGVIVDEGPVDDVLERPTHEYTKSLLANIPEL
ncbi:ABC transporter ATP-binding protein [Corynebacterium coyleae]|uniref:ABC transporter ATP-binding protein n=1 Tax=Corynebacterium coyleae TaxID=53374 RepID=UPI00254EB37A|nr:ABC transporter ATP-binding protein [Corynebacterium coyleae]MDK6493645.1 ABC transporter ATP-binding protein [Corynebacterium coyleae]